MPVTVTVFSVLSYTPVNPVADKSLSSIAAVVISKSPATYEML